MTRIENPHSVTFALPDEVNFAKTADIISPGVPGGWFRIGFTCGPFGYCGNDPFDPTTWTGSGGTLRTPIQAVAYSLQFANSQDPDTQVGCRLPIVPAIHRLHWRNGGGIRFIFSFSSFPSSVWWKREMRFLLILFLTRGIPFLFWPLDRLY